MSRRCELTGIGPMVGHSVSHSNVKTKRRFLPSLKTVKVASESLGQTFSLRISNAALRTLDYKGGLTPSSSRLATKSCRSPPSASSARSRPSWLNRTPLNPRRLTRFERPVATPAFFFARSRG